MKEIEIFDTTLRDGSQAQNVSFTVYDKLRIVEILNDFGIDYIELGWPFSNVKDNESFQKVQTLNINSKIVAFGSTHRTGVSVENDGNLKSIVDSGAKVACIFGKTIKQHIELQLKTTPETNLDIIKNSILYLKSKGLIVFFDAEHFFDGFKDDKDYAMKCLETAKEAGAERLVLCDTNGGTLPLETIKILKEVSEFFERNILGVHFHNDNGCAVGNSIIAAKYVKQIQGTINGFGERTGNADLCQILPNLVIKGKYSLRDIDLKKIKRVSEMLYTLSNNKPDNRQPYVGDFSFSHKGGVHVDAISKGASYEHISPELVGNKRRIVLSELAGKANIVEAGKKFGINIDKFDPKIKDALKEIEILEKKGYDISSLKAEQFLILNRHFYSKTTNIDILQWKVMSEYRNGEFSEAVMVGNIDSKKQEVVALVEGVGPVGATYQAMQKLFLLKYPFIAKVKLVNYKVRIAEDKGADSSVRVYVEFSQNGDVWGAAGVSTNILEASVEAIKKGFDFFVLNS